MRSPSARARATRTRIALAAEVLFEDKGFEGTRMEDVASSAGVSKALLYRYFNGREALVTEVLRSTFEEWSEVVAAAIGESGDSPIQALLAGFRRSVAFSLDRPITERIVRSERRAITAGYQAVLDEFGARSRERTRQQLRAGIAAGEIRADLDVQKSAELLERFKLAYIQWAVRDRSLASDDWIEAAAQWTIRGVLRAGSDPRDPDARSESE